MRRHLYAVGELSSEAGAQNARIRVVVAEAHPALRRSLRTLLEHELDLEVVGEATDIEGALRALRMRHPRVLVLDIRLPDGSSAEHVEHLRAQSPGTEIVIVTMDRNRAFAEQAFRSGAVGFVLKDSADVELCEAVRHAARGMRYTTPRLASW